CFSILLSQHPIEAYPIIAELAHGISGELSALDGFTWQNPDGISSVTIFLAALTLLLSASAGAFRCLAAATWELYTRADAPEHLLSSPKTQSGMIGMFGVIFGYVFSIVLFFAVYASIFLMILWEELTALLSHLLPYPALGAILSALRYPFLLLLFFGICLGLLRVLQPRQLRRHFRPVRVTVVPGALFCTIGLVAVTLYFSLFIRGSAKYSLVYGSLASMILFLMWIFLCGNILLIGTAINAHLLSRNSGSMHY
ncbi:MAG: YihY/virulence factor BrkB family protein, partial [Clostridia bacterium]|nr:YihY/virulence factor BrkB family protein [Clostridia bacterium]